MGNRVVVDTHDRNLQRWLERAHYTAGSMPLLSGRLLTPISGLGYRTASHRGITNQRGEFRYRQNEQVTFYLGEVALPAANASSTVTPYDMGRSPHAPTNVLRLLQSLCIACNGTLTLPAYVAQHACEAIDFSVATHRFPQQSAVVRLLDTLGCALVDAAIAIEGFDAMLARHIQDSYLNTTIRSCHNAAASSDYCQSLNTAGEKHRY